MNGNGSKDYQTRAIITGLIILCATALTIMKIMTPDRWEYIALTAGVVYMGVKFAKDYLANAKTNGGGMKTDYNSLIATAIRESTRTALEMKNGGQSNDPGIKT